MGGDWTAARPHAKTPIADLVFLAYTRKFHAVLVRQPVLVSILELYSESIEWRWDCKTKVIPKANPLARVGFFILGDKDKDHDYLDAATCYESGDRPRL